MTRRPLLLDVGLLLSGEGSPAERRIAGALAAMPQAFIGLVRTDAHGLVSVPAEAMAPRAAALARADPFDAVRAWLLGQGSRPEPAAAARRPLLSRLRPGRAVAAVLPPGAVVLAAGLGWWDAPRVDAGRADVAIVALVDGPVGLDWPESVGAAEAGATPRRLAAMAAGTALVVVPGEATRDRLEAVFATLPHSPPVRMVAPPALAEVPVADDAPLSAAGYFLAIDRIEARANTALLLHLWRDLLRDGGPVPKLVLAGERGAQVEEIKPLLDWNATIARHVTEAPGLSRAGLAHLAAHARAVLAPAFVPLDGSLLDDIAALGTPLIAAGADAPREATRLSPIDGPGWRQAIRAAPPARLASRRPAPPPPPRDPAAAILTLVAAL